MSGVVGWCECRLPTAAPSPPVIRVQHQSPLSVQNSLFTGQLVVSSVLCLTQRVRDIRTLVMHTSRQWFFTSSTFYNIVLTVVVVVYTTVDKSRVFNTQFGIRPSPCTYRWTFFVSSVSIFSPPPTDSVLIVRYFPPNNSSTVCCLSTKPRRSLSRVRRICFFAAPFVRASTKHTQSDPPPHPTQTLDVVFQPTHSTSITCPSLCMRYSCWPSGRCVCWPQTPETEIIIRWNWTRTTGRTC